MKKLFSPLLTALLFTPAPPAWACASCACGDPTLTVMGTEKPFSGRLRLGAEARLRWLSSGVRAVDRIDLAEQRLAVEAAWAPVSELFLTARAPFVRRELELADFSRATLFNVGDLELGAKWFVYQDRSLAARHLLAVEASVEIPTAPLQSGPNGEDLGFEAQLGSGSFDPAVGVSYAWFPRPISVFASLRGLFPTDGRFGARAGTALLASSVLQIQANGSLALRAGLDFRWETPFVVDGQADPHSGGAALFATPELLFSGLSDVVVRLAVSVPAWLDLRGTQTEGPTVRLGVVLDV